MSGQQSEKDMNAVSISIAIMRTNFRVAAQEAFYAIFTFLYSTLSKIFAFCVTESLSIIIYKKWNSHKFSFARQKLKQKLSQISRQMNY